jgi:hypothetical protein
MKRKHEMNIFKVLASGGKSSKSMPEELMSVFLAWLLHPNMEHGLGCQFLNRFLEEINCDDIVLKHRFKSVKNIEFICELEYNVDSGFIDIVYFIGDIIIAIENKINRESLQEEQLLRYYKKKKKNFDNSKKIVMVYLVPEISERVCRECDSVESMMVGTADKCISITWSYDIFGIIENILSDERESKAEPISEYIKHTLKALNVFIQNEFKGYDYERRPPYTAKHPMMSLNDLKAKKQGFVGIRYGIAGLIRTSRDIIATRSFQYDDSSNVSRKNWVALKDFLVLAEWRINGNDLPEDFKWDIKLDSSSIYTVVSQLDNHRIYVGILG